VHTAPQGKIRRAALFNALETSLIDCPDRAWHGAGDQYANARVLLVDNDDRVALANLWQGMNGEPMVNPLDMSDIGPEWMSLFN